MAADHNEREVLSQDESNDEFYLVPEQNESLQRFEDLVKAPLEKYCQTIVFESARELLRYFQSHMGESHMWAYRGQADESWPLAPSLERIRASNTNLRRDAEGYVLNSFKRRAHHFLRDIPGESDELEWLALLRHHGGPTRLLDWTRSPYVAAFFAVADMKDDVTSAVWVIDILSLKTEAIEILAEANVIALPESGHFSFSDRDVFNEVILRESLPVVVVPVQPFRTNERVTSQQGLFLCTNSSNRTFEFGLKQVLQCEYERYCEWCAENYPGTEPETPREQQKMLKLCIRPTVRRELLIELHRMNINYATLFPDIDGFSRSLGTNLTIVEDGYLGCNDFDSTI